jgi:peptidoglycan-associated lipoprotein
MRHSSCLVALAVVALAVGACHKNPPPAAPAPPPAPETPPPAPAPPPREVAPQLSEYDSLKGKSIDEINRMGLLAEIHFEFNKSDIREGDRQILTKNAEVLKKFDFIKVTVEGHCDERGSVEYNLALGERRAKVAFDYLISLGVPADRLKTVSYGKEVPVCHEATDECYARNRRDAFVVTGKTK